MHSGRKPPTRCSAATSVVMQAARIARSWVTWLRWGRRWRSTGVPRPGEGLAEPTVLGDTDGLCRPSPCRAPPMHNTGRTIGGGGWRRT